MDEQYLCWRGVPRPGLAPTWLKGEEEWLNRVQQHVLKNSSWLNDQCKTLGPCFPCFREAFCIRNFKVPEG